MFLDIVRNNNFDLIKIALDFHKRGLILPDSYILDVDTILENAARILEEANKNNIKLYAMTKQIGRVPYIAKKIVDIGYLGVVTVDFKEAQIMIHNNIKLGNVGHLVQIPNKMIEEVVKYGSDIITVYSLDKILEINKAAEKIGKVQDIMIKVIDNNDTIYPGQYGGFYLDDIKKHIDKILPLKNIRINGITSFPCFLYNSDSNRIEATRNIETIHKCNDILNEFGVKVEQLNMPSATSLENIKYIKEYGGTHGEPGHALTGTTPFNSINFSQEKPAIIYLSEISHNLNSKSYFYGGGHYRRSHMSKLLVGNDAEHLIDFKVNVPSLDNIDYYFDFDNYNKNVNIGDAVISSFRTQIFVTRSDVVLIEGIKSGNPKIVGIYDSLGRIK